MHRSYCFRAVAGICCVAVLCAASFTFAAADAAPEPPTSSVSQGFDGQSSLLPFLEDISDWIMTLDVGSNVVKNNNDTLHTSM